jgi:outer membrane protein TolC
MTNLYARKFHLAIFYPFMIIFMIHGTVAAQEKILLLSEAVNRGVGAYQTVKAKQNYILSSQALVKNAHNERLPNVALSLQQDFGTINGQFGPSSAFGAFGVSSSGPPSANQSWNAAFGASYVINTNWEFFTFGRLNSRISLSEAQVNKDSADLAQEIFVLSAKISGAYLQLIIAQQLVDNANANLQRTLSIQEVVLARTRSGLNAGVDSSIANATIASARLALISAHDTELQIRNQLAQLLNDSPANPIATDTSYLKNIPREFASGTDISLNPQAKFYQARITQSDRYADYIKKSILPGVNLFGIYQARGSGFDYNYTPDYSNRYKTGYFNGVNPSRSNYVAGISLAWNILSVKKIKEQAIAQRFISKAYQQEYDLISAQLKDQLILADQRIANALLAFKEAPAQLKAASDAYLQKNVLYRNGLTNIIDVQQALYAVNKAETDLAVTYIQVWQALLLKAASSGDIDLFLKQVR